MDRLARGKIETGVVPGAAHLAIHQQPFRQRPAPVGARGADGMDGFPHPGDENRLTVRVPQQHRAIGELRFGNARSEVGAG